MDMSVTFLVTHGDWVVLCLCPSVCHATCKCVQHDVLTVGTLIIPLCICLAMAKVEYFKYMTILLALFPQWIMEYNLNEHVLNGKVNLELIRAVWGLPQA
jgi:hypothetical protein